MAGRSRGRGISNVTAAPVPSQGLLKSCFYTDYDGVDDYNTSTDSALAIVGSQTWAMELYIPETDVPDRFLISNGLKGYTLRYDDTNGYFVQINDGTNNGYISTSTPITKGQWIKLIVVMQTNSVSTRIFVDGTEYSNHFGVTASLPNPPASNFNIGTAYVNKVPNAADMFLRNLEIYSGAATNAASWIPGDTSSLTNTTLVMQSKDGSGVINENGIGSWTTTGDPQTVEC